MEQDKSKLEFLKAFCKLQSAIEPVKTDSTNPHFHSKYASLAGVNQAVMKMVNEYGFMIIQGGEAIDGKPYLRTDLCHVGGHAVSYQYPLTVSDNPQHVSSSCTYAARVSICRLLNLSIEDDDAETATQPLRTVSDSVKKTFTKEDSQEVVYLNAQFIPKEVK